MKGLTWLLADAGFELGVDLSAKSKTAVMTNDDGLERICIKASVRGAGPVEYEIPILRGDETYKYLGVHINTNLGWEKQLELTANRVKYHAAVLRRKCFPAVQTVRIINQVIIPAVTARLAAVEVPVGYLATLDRILGGLVNNKMGMRYNASLKYLHLDQDKGGAGLMSLTVEVPATQVETVVFNGVMSKDTITKEYFAMEESRRQVERTIEQITSAAPGPKGLKPKMAEATPGDLGTVEVGTRENKRSYLVATVLQKWSDPSTERVVKAVLAHERKPLPIPCFLATGLIPPLEELGTRVAFCDGSKTAGREATYGVYGKGYHSFSGSAANTDDVDRAEALGSIHAVLVAIVAKRAEVYTDSAYVELLWNKKLEGGKRDANSDLIPIIEEILAQADRTGRTVVVKKVYSHVLDARDRAEREKRKGWMKEMYPERYAELIEGNYRADRLAGAGHAGRAYYLPPYLTLRPAVYPAAGGGRIRSVRTYMREVHQVSLEREIGGKLRCYKWLREANLGAVDINRTNDIMGNRSYKTASLVAFTMRMRRKDLRENAPFQEKAHSNFFRSRYSRPPTSDRCPMCGVVEKRGHFMTKCPETKFIREEIRVGVQKFLGRGLTSRADPLPMWWDADEVNTWKGFKAKWGAMGVIPANLNKWIKRVGKVKEKETRATMIAEMQIKIIEGARAAWIYRRKREKV